MKSQFTSVRTFDSMTRSVSRKTLDTILSAATPGELAEWIAGAAKRIGYDPGTLWAGVFNAMDKSTRDEVLEVARNYQSGELDPLGHGKPNPDDPAARKKVADGVLNDLIDNRAFGDKWNEDRRRENGQPSLRS